LFVRGIFSLQRIFTLLLLVKLITSVFLEQNGAMDSTPNHKLMGLYAWS
jgi:hypothetical protein